MNSDQNTLIKIRDIKKIYRLGPTDVHALDGISLDIEQGDFVAIMGPSGSGKSTLAHILALLDIPSSGTYQFQGEEVSQLSEDDLAVIRRDEIGFVFQQFNLLPRMSALENIALPTFYSNRTKPLEVSQELLKRVGLDERGEHQPNELSGGQQQRVAIARALVNSPKVILADEPTGNLDSKSESEIMSLLKELNNQGITIIMVTHEDEIGRQAKRLIRVRDGKLQSDERLSESVKKDITTKVEYQRQYFFTEFIQHFTQGVRILASNKVRTFLSILGILIGVAAVVSMMAIGRGAQEQIQEQMARLGTNLLVLRPGAVRRGGVAQEAGASSRLLPSDAQFLEQAIPSISKISPTVRGRAQVIFENKNWNTRVEGVWPDYETMRASEPEFGRFFTNEENIARERVAVIGRTVFNELFSGENPLGQMIKINRINFQVIGVMGEKGDGGWRDPDDTILIPLNTAMYRLLGEEYVDRIEIEVADFSLMEATEEAILEAMIRRKRIPQSLQDGAFRVRNLAEIQEAASESNRTMSFLLAAIAGISLLVGGIGIMNIMLVSVTERTREIGLRKAIGAKRKDIMAQFLVESVMVSFSGGLLGVAIGCISAIGLTYFSGWATSISLYSIVLAFSFSVLIGIIFGIYPARKASQLQPIKALRFE